MGPQPQRSTTLWFIPRVARARANCWFCRWSQERCKTTCGNAIKKGVEMISPLQNLCECVKRDHFGPTVSRPLLLLLLLFSGRFGRAERAAWRAARTGSTSTGSTSTGVRKARVRPRCTRTGSTDTGSTSPQGQLPRTLQNPCESMGSG